MVPVLCNSCSFSYNSSSNEVQIKLMTLDTAIDYLLLGQCIIIPEKLLLLSLKNNECVMEHLCDICAGRTHVVTACLQSLSRDRASIPDGDYCKAHTR